MPKLKKRMSKKRMSKKRMSKKRMSKKKSLNYKGQKGGVYSGVVGDCKNDECLQEIFNLCFIGNKQGKPLINIELESATSLNVADPGAGAGEAAEAGAGKATAKEISIMFTSSGNCVMENKFIEKCEKDQYTKHLKFNIYLVDIIYNTTEKKDQENKFRIRKQSTEVLPKELTEVLPKELTNVNKVKAFNINESLEQGTKIDIVIGINDEIVSQCLYPRHIINHVPQNKKNEKKKRLNELVCETLSYAGYHTPYIRVAGSKYYIQKVGEYIFKPLGLDELYVKFSDNMNHMYKNRKRNTDIFSLLQKHKITVKIDELMELDKVFYEGKILNFEFNDGTKIIKKKYSELTDEDKQDNLGFFELCNIYKKIPLMQDLPPITIKLHLEKILTKNVDNECRIIIKKLWSSILYGFTPNIKIILDLDELHRKFINNMNTINKNNRSNPDIFSLFKKPMIIAKTNKLNKLYHTFYEGGILNFEFVDGTKKKYSELTDEDKQDNLGFFELCNIYKKKHPTQDLPSITIKLHLEKIPTKIVDDECRIIIKKLWSSIIYGFTPNIKIIYQLPEHFNTKKLTPFSQ